MPLRRALYHSIRLSKRIPIVYSLTPADADLVSHHSFSFANTDGHATTSSHTPFNSSQRADSNELLLYTIRRLTVELLCFLNVPRYSPTPRLIANEGYGHASASGYTPFDSSQRGHSNNILPDLIRLLAVELSCFLDVPKYYPPQFDS